MMRVFILTPMANVQQTSARINAGHMNSLSWSQVTQPDTCHCSAKCSSTHSLEFVLGARHIPRRNEGDPVTALRGIHSRGENVGSKPSWSTR